MVEFWPSFDCAWFGAVGANGEQIGREEGEQFEVTPGALRRRGVEQERRPLSHPGERGLERDAPQRHVVGAGGVLQDGANQIVGDGLQQDLALDHRWGASAQHIQPEGRLDVAEVALDLPAQAIQLDQRRVRIRLLVEQAGRQDHFLGAEPRHLDPEAHHSHH